MRSLFDGHPAVFCVPIESHFFQIMKYWVDYNYRKESPDTISFNEIKSRFIHFIKHMNASEDLLSDGYSKGILNDEVFVSKIDTWDINWSDKEFFEYYMEALYESVVSRKPGNDIRIVEKSVEHAEFASELYKWFPKASFIHIVRNPYANIVSLRKYKSVDHGFPLINRIYHSLRNSYYFLYKNAKLIDNYIIVKYEDLVSEPEKTMRMIAEKINLSWDQSLLIPTQQGESWKGNSTSGKQFSGVSDNNLFVWKKDIYPLEALIINKCFSFVLDRFMYENYEIKGSIWKRANGENLKRYLYNRLFSFYLEC